MDKIQVISGTTSVYDSHKMKEPFAKADAYPIAWEIIFHNDNEGKIFAADLAKAFRNLPKDKGLVLDTEIPTNEPIRCIECVFRDKDSFRKIINEVFADHSLMDDTKGQIIPKMKLLNDATKVIQQQTILAF